MSLAVDIIKHGGKRPSEKFMPEKLRNSIIAACLSVKTPEGQAEMLADNVLQSVNEWLKQRPEVTSSDLRIIAVRHLKEQHPEAAYIYEQHRITL